jgi:hypothetical protein
MSLLEGLELDNSSNYLGHSASSTLVGIPVTTTTTGVNHGSTSDPEVVDNTEEEAEDLDDVEIIEASSSCNTNGDYMIHNVKNIF